ncbi:MAG TPA: ABC transporter substrate-binding protein, partial [Gemmatimonadaceae bacterium]|nr:ABC transporter substrate-binding protein [Gemmatimonadaceae bacterium]
MRFAAALVSPHRSTLRIRISACAAYAACAACATLAILAASCTPDATRTATASLGATNTTATNPSSVARDDFGRAIPFAIRPHRVVSLNPTTTEVMFAIGAGTLLVGRSHWDDWPDSARTIPDMGNGISPNVEKIVAAHP